MSDNEFFGNAEACRAEAEEWAAEAEPTRDLYQAMVQCKHTFLASRGSELEEPAIGSYQEFVEKFNWFRAHEPYRLYQKVGAWQIAQSEGQAGYDRECKGPVDELEKFFDAYFDEIRKSLMGINDEEGGDDE